MIPLSWLVFYFESYYFKFLDRSSLPDILESEIAKIPKKTNPSSPDNGLPFIPVIQSETRPEYLTILPTLIT
jgi:hypothetical protein